MMNKQPRVIWALVLLLIAAMMTSTFAGEGLFTPRGSWTIVNNLGTRAVGTFHEGGTFVISFRLPGSSANSSAHGVWKRTGPRTFTTTDQIFVFDDEGQATSVIKDFGSFRLSRNGQRFTGQLVVETRTLEGRVIDTGQVTIRARRITVEPSPVAIQ